ncbi:MAG: hypothetical protein HF973_15455 [Chloroflexi bacterium]|nr:hypothetical protein [Chloroflexota bacterium]
MNQIVSVSILLTRLAFRLIPPGVWLGALFIVALWLGLMIKIWQPHAWQRRTGTKQAGRRVRQQLLPLRETLRQTWKSAFPGPRAWRGAAWGALIALAAFLLTAVYSFFASAGTARFVTGTFLFLAALALSGGLVTPEKARLTEFSHLRQTLGSAVWPGWGDAKTPVIVYNEAYAFLVGYPGSHPPDGWVKMPQNEQQGGPWEPVPDDTFNGQVYYRQHLPASGATPQAFTVRVGAFWAASLTTKEWMAISLTNQLREDLPAPLRPIFPYRLAIRLLIGSSDLYVTMLAHESFHAYQGTIVPERLAAAETAVHHQNNYPWNDADLQAAWQTELNLLQAALAAESKAETAVLSQQFLQQRQQRRQTFGLEGALTDYERQREWLEG